MTTNDFTTTLVVAQSPAEVFDAILNVRGWWHGEVQGNTTTVNDEFEYRMKHFHYSKQRLTEIIPNQKVVWLVTDSNLSFTQKKNEWTNTTVSFEITEKENQTEIRFTHHGLTSQFECYGDCSNGWTMLIQESLKNLITTGKGVEVFG